MKKPGAESSLRAQWLGERMRGLRKRKQISQEAAALHIRRNGSMLGRYESGEYPFRRDDVVELLDFYSVSNEVEREGLLKQCDDIWRKNWWDQHRDDLGHDFINVPWLESRAERINTYQHLLVHGLVQTRAYAEALIRNEAPDRTPEDRISRWLDVRVERQQVLHRDEPVKLSIVMEEVVLQRPVGTPDVMQEQLQHLLDLAAYEHIDIRIMPTMQGLHKAHAGSFYLFELPDPYPDVTYIETVGGSLYVEQPIVKQIHEVWENVNIKSLSPDLSQSLIKEHSEALT